MTDLGNLKKIKTKSKKRVGRGYGSGKGGHTVGRGAKGEKARGKVGLVFEGTKIKKSLIRRLPFRRGKGKFKSLSSQPIPINLTALNLIPKGTVVDLKVLLKHGIVKEKEAGKFGVKILGGGKLEHPLTIGLACSKAAAEKIKKAGGQVENLKTPPKRKK
jgi:large subunit ribosomal protein L15